MVNSIICVVDTGIDIDVMSSDCHGPVRVYCVCMGEEGVLEYSKRAVDVSTKKRVSLSVLFCRRGTMMSSTVCVLAISVMISSPLSLC